MAIEHMSDEQLQSIVVHAGRRNKRYVRMLRALNVAIAENDRNRKEAWNEYARRVMQDKGDA